MKKMTLIILAIVIYIVSFTSYVHASLNKNKIEYDVFEVVKVKSGETLWHISDRYNEYFGMSLVDMLDVIYEFNGLEDSIIHPGQKVMIPNLDV